MKIYPLALCLVLLTTFSGCSNSDKKKETPTITLEEGRRLQLANSFDRILIPSHTKHNKRTEDMKLAIDRFGEDPNETNLTALKTAWKQAFSAFGQIELYKIGTIEVSFLHANIHQWPCQIDDIEKHIAGKEELNNAYIESLGASSKGYAALEYLLFNEDAQATLVQFTATKNADRRIQYLQALGENLTEQSDQLLSYWKSGENDFKGQLESGISGSQNKLINGYVALLETIKSKKMDKPFRGVEPKVSDLEAYRSSESLQAIKANQEALKKEYLGAGAEDFSMSDFVIEVLKDPTLDRRIKEGFVRIDDAIQAIDNPLEDNLSQKKSSAENLREEFMNMIVLIKVDLSSAANIVVTFNDNDGDS